MRRYYLINRESEKPKEKTVDISNQIVYSAEEQMSEYDSPEQRVWPRRPTVYPTGEMIPESLPNSYLPSQSCGNCAAYDPKISICSIYIAPVMASYWCRSWKAK